MSPVDREDGSEIRVETTHFEATIALSGYVSGVKAATFLDKKSGARDLGFGLDVVDFLLEPTEPNVPISKGQYEFNDKIHGKIPKRYVEGPQICTQASRLPARVDVGPNWTAVRMQYRWSQAFEPHGRAGSLWEQTLVFPHDTRYFLAADRVTTLNDSPALFLRVDMPGHIKLDIKCKFDHVYLSYHSPSIVPSTDFAADFAPDERFLYHRGEHTLPERFIRAYQVDLGPGKDDGPWLAGMTLEPSDVFEAWCHQRGYVCMIEEIGGRSVKRGDTFGACYVVGWFDDLDEMHRIYDAHRGASGLEVLGTTHRAPAWKTLTPAQLEPVKSWDEG